MRLARYALYTLFIVIVAGYTSLAQDNEVNSDVSLRLVCIETMGCLYTSLDDDALDVQFGTDLERFESLSDFEPSGVWDNVNVDSGEQCQADGLLDAPDRMVLITEIDDSDNIQVMDDFSLTNSLYTRIGEGIYVGKDTVADAQTFIQYLEFIIVKDENTMISIGIGTRQEGDTITEINFMRCYIYLGQG